MVRMRDAQAGLRLCCSQTPKDRFSRDEAHFIILNDDIDISMTM